MSASWIAELRGVIGESRWGAQRVAGLAPPERELYGSLLRAFADGREPDGALAGRRHALGRLVEGDLVAIDRDGAVVVAYPFSARPTRHRVLSEDGRRHWAMCAIDALAIPFLLRRRAEIHARSAGNQRPVTVMVDPVAGAIVSNPGDATVVAARAGPGCAASCACPYINLFGSRADADRHLAASGLHGTVLTVADAAAAGRALFGGLRELLAGPPTRVPAAADRGADRGAVVSEKGPTRRRRTAQER
jgi:hypothetical protein